MGQHPAPHQDRNLVGSNFVGFGFAPRPGLHRARVPQDNGDALFGPELRQPRPRKQTLAPDAHSLAVRRDHAQPRFGRGGQMLLDQNRPRLSKNTDVQGTGRSIDAALMVMVLRVEVHARWPPWE